LVKGRGRRRRYEGVIEALRKGDSGVHLIVRLLFDLLGQSLALWLQLTHKFGDEWGCRRNTKGEVKRAEMRRSHGKDLMEESIVLGESTYESDSETFHGLSFLAWVLNEGFNH